MSNLTSRVFAIPSEAADALVASIPSLAEVPTSEWARFPVVVELIEWLDEKRQTWPDPTEAEA